MIICVSSSQNEFNMTLNRVLSNTAFDNDNDNDNDNEIIFIAKWHTNHVQKVMIKTKPVIGLLYMKHIEPGKGDVKPSWLMCPNINYTKEIVSFGVQSRNSAECWNSFNSMLFLSCTCMSCVPQEEHICTYIYMCTHLYTNLTWLPLMH